MVNLKFKPRALSELKIFIRSYEEAFYDLFKDSGIWSEDLIISIYRDSAKELYSNILGEIGKRLTKKQILGRKTLGSWHELDFYVGSRLVIVYYSQNSKRNIRFVESIAIDRKPIIF